MTLLVRFNLISFSFSFSRMKLILVDIDVILHLKLISFFEKKNPSYENNIICYEKEKKKLCISINEENKQTK